MTLILEEREISLDEILLLAPETLKEVLAALDASNAPWDRETVAQERDADRWEQRLRHAIAQRAGQ